MSSIVHKEERIGHLWSKKNEVSRYISLSPLREMAFPKTANALFSKVSNY